MEPEPRYRRRMPCSFAMGPRKHSGVVLDVSRTGLFLQTTAPVAVGQPLDLELRTGRAEIVLHGKVVWQKLVPAALRNVAEGGLGIRISAADESYFQLLAELSGNATAADRRAGDRTAATPSSASPEVPAHRYRVRVRQQVGPRSRWIHCAADSAADAEAAALRRLGVGWEVAELEQMED
jgi:hypothetical protein